MQNAIIITLQHYDIKNDKKLLIFSNTDKSNNDNNAMQNRLTLPKQKRQQSLPTFSSMCAHPTTL